ncbi:hypothetical protein C8A01DRAFT_51500 [Parachaetomium inaequale]|uniref:NACHT domain-containing protein n=1 Tax=Parachaetomium inaequale TaxID=2588326 RepID=A0AAN6P4F6_9PEZI|nr:hypothetical protein C8A01DRAFT_51500 [Parachaetomium inaequale]
MAATREDPFARARDEFLSTLASEERAQFSSCSSVGDLLDNIRCLPNLTRAKRRVKPCLDKIKALGDNLAPYFKIIEIFCASHAESANLVLGALHLILKLASHFVTFFEKLCDTVEMLNTKLPRYQELYNSLCQAGAPSISPRLRSSLLEIYCRLFQFFGAVARVFSKHDGEIKRTPVVVASLMWKPFDARFQVALESIKLHADIVKEELQFSTMGELRSAFQQEAANVNKQHEAYLDALEHLQQVNNGQAQERFLASVTAWLNAPDYKVGYEKACQERTEGTNEWLFDHPTFRSWHDSESGPTTPHNAEHMAHQYPASLLWINGKPGSGKTVLASSVVETLSRNGVAQTEFPPEVCYYFFSQTLSPRGTLSDFYRATATQLFHRFHKLEKIYNVFAFATLDMQTQRHASESELVEIISQCLPHLPNLYFVVDAVDECTESAQLLRQLAEWCTCSPLGVVIFSRPDVASLCRSVRQDRQILLARQVLDADIRRYVEDAVEELLEQRLLPADADVEIIVSHLTNRAEGMFLWIRLMISYLDSLGMTRAERLAMVMEPNTEGLDRLDDMYSRIQRRIDSSNPHSKSLARRALMWTVHTSLTSSELKDALFPEGWDSGEDDEGADLFDHAVIIVCCGLVEKDCNGRFQFIHLTARVFAQRGSARSGGSPLTPGEIQGKALLATRCLSYLTSQVPAKPLSGKMQVKAARPELRQRWPLLGFATLHWIILVLGSIKTSADAPDVTEVAQMVQLATDFLNQPLRLMVWIEALYTYCAFPADFFVSVREALGSPHPAPPPHRRLTTQPKEKTNLISEIRELVGDLDRVHKTWGKILLKNPAEIWGDVTAFTKSRFMASTRAAVLESLTPRLEIAGKHAVAETITPVFSVSMSSSDATRLGVLSIFPNEAFRRGWADMTDIPRYHNSFQWKPGRTSSALPSTPRTPTEISDACTGWFATYEIFVVQESRSDSAAIATIPLDAEDIAICLRQSLRFSPTGGWKCSFPITIAPELDKASILTNVFHFGADGTTSTVAPIPAHCHPRLQLVRSPETRFTLSYSYRLFWSLDSRFLAVTDSGLFEQGWRELTFLAIFSTAAVGKMTQLVNHSMVPITHSAWLQDCAFHPKLPLFLYRIDASVFLWDFRRAGSAPIPFHELPPWPANSQSQSVSFSHCGRYLAVLHHGRNWPELIQLPSLDPPEDASLPLALKRPPVDEGDPEPSPKRAKRTAAESDPTPTTALDLFVPGRLPTTITNTLVLRQDSATGTANATILQNSSTGELAILNGDDARSSTIAVATLPLSIPLHSVSSTVSMPSRPDQDPDAGAGAGAVGGQWKLIVTAKPAGTYCSDEPPAAAHLPLVLRKDVRALRVEHGPARLRGGGDGSGGRN